jgi:dihydrodipicolinate synthase/N-acetylneuraminate lyase
MLPGDVRKILHQGVAIPAHPLALDENRRFDERSQRALSRYYLAAGAGGLAVGVHTTQFAIHDPRIGLYEPVLALAAEELSRVTDRPVVRVAGVLGDTPQAVREAALASELGYHAGLLSLSALRGASEAQLLAHCRAVAGVVPVFGFYLQPAVGGVRLPYSFWRRFLEIPMVVAIKVAAFNRYHTLDVVRAVAESGRDDVALYTGNDDNIVFDLLTPFRFSGGRTQRFVGGLLGHWAVWTKRAVELLRQCQAASQEQGVPDDLLATAVAVTDCNAAVFDVAHDYAGCIPGILEVLRRQGLVRGTWCLDEHETLSPGQVAALDRVCRTYPHLMDDDWVAEHRDAWLR